MAANLCCLINPEWHCGYCSHKYCNECAKWLDKIGIPTLKMFCDVCYKYRDYESWTIL